MKAFVIILCAVLGFALIGVFSVNSCRNTAINLEENVGIAPKGE